MPSTTLRGRELKYDTTSPQGRAFVASTSSRGRELKC